MDNSVDKVIYGWVLNIQGSLPNVTKSVQVQDFIFKDKRFTYEYQNKYHFPNFYTFTSSEPGYLEVIDSVIELGPYEKNKVRMLIPFMNHILNKSVKVIITDSKETVSECVEFNI